MESTICRHKNTIIQKILIYCLGCVQILMKNCTKCEHRGILIQDSVARCVNCGKILYEHKQDNRIEHDKRINPINARVV
jgi:ribosomal protein S27E